MFKYIKITIILTLFSLSLYLYLNNKSVNIKNNSYWKNEILNIKNINNSIIKRIDYYNNNQNNLYYYNLIIKNNNKFIKQTIKDKNCKINNIQKCNNLIKLK